VPKQRDDPKVAPVSRRRKAGSGYTSPFSLSICATLLESIVMVGKVISFSTFSPWRS
jgi:hypothetical protein